MASSLEERRRVPFHVLGAPKVGAMLVSKPDALLDHLGALHICLSI
jgi:hypothetical protein